MHSRSPQPPQQWPQGALRSGVAAQSGQWFRQCQHGLLARLAACRFQQVAQQHVAGFRACTRHGMRTHRRRGNSGGISTTQGIQLDAKLGEDLALEHIPTHAGVPGRRRTSIITGPDNAYSPNTQSKVRAGANANAISAITTPTNIMKGTRSDRGPLPPPLKLV